MALRGVIGFLSGFEDEGVVFDERDGIGGQFVQARIAQAQRRVRPAWRMLLTQNVSQIVGAEGAGRGSFFNRAGRTIADSETERYLGTQ